MKTKTRESVSSLSSQWRDERQEMDRFFRDVRQWMNQVSQLGVPHFGETADRLSQFRRRLAAHFDREDQIAARMATSQHTSASAVDAARGRARSDHGALQRKLDDLISRLAATDPLFKSWQEATSELEEFIDALERHEDREAESIEWLSPAAETEGMPGKKPDGRRPR